MMYNFLQNFDDYPGFKPKITPPQHFPSSPTLHNQDSWADSYMYITYSHGKILKYRNQLSPFHWMVFAQFIKAQTLINEQDGIFSFKIY